MFHFDLVRSLKTYHLLDFLRKSSKINFLLESRYFSPCTETPRYRFSIASSRKESCISLARCRAKRWREAVETRIDKIELKLRENLEVWLPNIIKKRKASPVTESSGICQSKLSHWSRRALIVRQTNARSSLENLDKPYSTSKSTRSPFALSNFARLALEVLEW
jgi:hypothetical protein